MQGYIIHTNKVKDEDLIVYILTDTKLYTSYRFYGARHSIINVGYKIDFELETNLKSNIPRLKEVIHLGFSWIEDKLTLYNWQRFIKLFYPHLKDVEQIDSFYFNFLDTISYKIGKQDSKRAIIEHYILLCDFEGRLHKEFECLLCEESIIDNLSLVRGFVPTHSYCSLSKRLDIDHIKQLFKDKVTINLSDDEIEYLWRVLLQGL
jgi:hypothetical protein